MIDPITLSILVVSLLLGAGIAIVAIISMAYVADWVKTKRKGVIYKPNKAQIKEITKKNPQTKENTLVFCPTDKNGNINENDIEIVSSDKIERKLDEALEENDGLIYVQS